MNRGGADALANIPDWSRLYLNDHVVVLVRSLELVHRLVGLYPKGPYVLVKHPLYTGASFLVLPALGFLLNNWLGLLFGIILYIATRIYRPEEEKRMKKEFGEKYEKYSKGVLLPWL